LNVRLDDRAVDLRLRPVQLLLAYLLLNRDKTHRREQLAGILWPDYTETSARKNLRNTVYRLRQAVGEEYVAAERSTITFNAAAAYWLDVAQLEESTAAEEVEDLIQAVGLYQGELLPGFYEDWILWERERLQAVFERQMQALLARLNDAGRWPESLTWAEHWIAQGRVPEPAYRALMQAHAGLGDQASMAQAYRRGRLALEETLGVPPAAETERLYRELLAGDERESITTAATEEVVGAMPRARLPRPVTPFIGRQRELAELHRWLEDEASGRLVTIVGPGGMGKTRLALAAARARQRAGQTTAFISLTELDEGCA
jgi:DNA-binding SARP family transcriptional activator